MGWYKRSSAAQLTDTVRKWLLQAYRGTPDLRLVDADLDQFPPTIEDEQAIEMGAQMAQSQLNLPELTTIQKGVIDHIRSKVTHRQQQRPEPMEPTQDDPLAMPAMGDGGEVQQPQVQTL
jgi:hypothetical protein